MFIQTLCRFISIRGCPCAIWSENDTSFTGANEWTSSFSPRCERRTRPEGATFMWDCMVVLCVGKMGFAISTYKPYQDSERNLPEVHKEPINIVCAQRIRRDYSHLTQSYICPTSKPLTPFNSSDNELLLQRLMLPRQNSLVPTRIICAGASRNKEKCIFL